jgi:hypothetical protein
VLVTRVTQHTRKNCRNEGWCCRYAIAREVITCSLASQCQVAKMLWYVWTLFQSTALPCVRSRQLRLVKSGLLFLQQTSFNIGKVSLSPSLWNVLLTHLHSCVLVQFLAIWCKKKIQAIMVQITRRLDNICQYLLPCSFIILIEYYLNLSFQRAGSSSEETTWYINFSNS